MPFKGVYFRIPRLDANPLLAQTIEHIANRIGNGIDEINSFMA
jgi:hypothetical protein